MTTTGGALLTLPGGTAHRGTENGSPTAVIGTPDSGSRAADAPVYETAGWTGPSMGGHLRVRVACFSSDHVTAAGAAARVGGRVEAWASRLTRFSEHSDLARLNADPSLPRRVVRPTLGSVLSWAQRAAEQTGGLVDVTLLDARLAAEHLVPAVDSDVRGDWYLETAARGAVVHRRNRVQFDLDGVAKGWIADRAVDLLRSWPAALVDADGDISIRIGGGVEWFVGVDDPRAPDAPDLAVLRFAGDRSWHRTLGVATSGTSVHRWARADGTADHHLIDPRTHRPAMTDVIQATVIAPTAREAEVLAKSAVILGSGAAATFLDRSVTFGAILLLETGEVLAIPRTEGWLA